MTNDSDFFSGLAELFTGTAVPLVLSVCATIVRLTRFGWQGWRHFVAGMTTSVFVGQVAFWGLSYFSLPATVDAAIISMTSYMGGSLLDAVFYRVRKEIVKGDLLKNENIETVLKSSNSSK